MNVWRPDWQQHAICRGMDTQLFMPKRGDHHTVRKAVKICYTCPVIQQCRDYSFQLEEEGLLFGVFGGLTQYGRREAFKEERHTGQPSPLRTVKPGLDAEPGLNAGKPRHVN